MPLRVRRVYEPPERDDGRRVLVDRIWPRGVGKDALVLDEWAKDIAPTTALRKWYGHDPVRFAEFRARYLAELEVGPAAAAVERLRAVADNCTLTLLTATKDVEHSHAAVLAALVRVEGDDE